jgi:hypothetical protein
MEKVAQQETPARKKRSSELLGLESIMLDEALEGLDVHEQETIRLIICDGLSYTQAARALDVPVSTINNWKHRALRKLRGTIDAADSQDAKQPFSSTQQQRDLGGSRGEQETRSQTPSGHLEQVSRCRPGRSKGGKGQVRVAG